MLVADIVVVVSVADIVVVVSAGVAVVVDSSIVVAVVVSVHDSACAKQEVQFTIIIISGSTYLITHN